MTQLPPTIGVFTTDTELIVRTWDPWLAGVSQISAEQAHGQALLALIPDLERRGILARFQRVLAEGVVEVLATSFHRYLIRCAPQIPTRHFDAMQQYVTIAPLRDSGQIAGTLVTIEDVTARCERERDLADDLASPDEGVRLRAAQSIAEESEAPATLLLDTLDDASWRVRRAAAHSLARRADSEVVAALVRTMRADHRKPGMLNSALQALALSGTDAVAPLLDVLETPDTDLRIYVVLALGEQKDARAVHALIQALHDPDINVRFHAIDALGHLRAPEAADALAEVVESRDFFLAFPALAALEQIGDSRVAASILPLLDDALLGEPAASALGQLGEIEAVAPLAAALNVPGAPAIAIAGALAAIHDRYAARYDEGSAITAAAQPAIAAAGAQSLLAALPSARGDELRALAQVLGWLEGPEIDRALVRLIGQPDVRGAVIDALVRHGARVVKLLIDQLGAEDPEIRQAAALALGRIGGPSVVPALLELLEDDAELALVATGALAKIGDRRAFEPLLGLLAHPNAALRRAAVGALNSLGHPGLAAHVALLLRDPNPLARESAVKIAGYFGYASCVEALLECCHDPDAQVQRAAIEHLPYIEDPRVLPALGSALRHEAAPVRAAAARALGAIEHAQAVPLLLEALRDADAWVRYYGARAAGRQADPAAIDALAGHAQHDGAQQVRIAAIEALGQIGGARAVAVLAPLASAEDDNLACATIGALGQANHLSAEPHLLAALQSRSPIRRSAAATALGRRGGQAAGALQQAAAAEPEPQVVAAITAALAHTASPEAVAALLELALDAGRREASIAALAELGDAQIELLARGLTDRNSDGRRVAIEALARIKRPRASEQLALALDDPEPTVRLAAATALARLGSHTARQQLARMAYSDPDPIVRHAALGALQR